MRHLVVIFSVMSFSVGFVSFSVELCHLVAMLCHIVANATFSGNI